MKRRLLYACVLLVALLSVWRPLAATPFYCSTFGCGATFMCGADYVESEGTCLFRCYHGIGFIHVRCPLPQK